MDFIAGNSSSDSGKAACQRASLGKLALNQAPCRRLQSNNMSHDASVATTAKENVDIWHKQEKQLPACWLCVASLASQASVCNENHYPVFCCYYNLSTLQVMWRLLHGPKAVQWSISYLSTLPGLLSMVHLLVNNGGALR